MTPAQGARDDARVDAYPAAPYRPPVFENDSQTQSNGDGVLGTTWSVAASLAIGGGLLGWMAGPLVAQEAPDDAPSEQPADASGGENRVDLGGYGSFRLSTFDQEEGEPSFTLRRFVVTTDARLAGKLQVYAEVEYERLTKIEIERGVEAGDDGIAFEQELEGTNGSELALEQAWAQYDVSPSFGVRMGAVLPPVGRYNIRHDDNLWSFPRRPLIDKDAQVLPAAAAWTEMGLGVVGQTYLGDTRLTYQAYMLGGTRLDFVLEQKVVTEAGEPGTTGELVLEAAVSPTQGAFDGSNPVDAFAGRMEVSPALGAEYAVSGYVGRYTPEFLEDTDETMWTLGFDGRQRISGFYFEGEFLYTRYTDPVGVTEAFAATALEHAVELEGEAAAPAGGEFVAEAEIALDGLSRNRYGFWLDLGRPIALAPGTFGLEAPTIIPVFRWERVWVDDELSSVDFSGGTVTELGQSDRSQQRFLAGVAFRPVPQAVLQLFWERTEVLEGASFDPLEEGEDARNAVTLGAAFGF